MEVARGRVGVGIAGLAATLSFCSSSGSVWSTLRQRPVRQHPQLLKMRTEVTPTSPLESYRAYLMGLARVLLANAGPVRNRVGASDLVQDVMLRAHKREKQFKGKIPEEFMGWLRQILKNELIDKERHFLRKKRDAALEETYRETIENIDGRMRRMPDLKQTSPSQHLARHEQQLLLVRALETLPEDQRTAVELRHLGELSLAEIAEFMDRSKASVAGLLRRGLKALREELKLLARIFHR